MINQIGIGTTEVTQIQQPQQIKQQKQIQSLDELNKNTNKIEDYVQGIEKLGKAITEYTLESLKNIDSKSLLVYAVRMPVEDNLKNIKESLKNIDSKSLLVYAVRMPVDAMTDVGRNLVKRSADIFNA